MLINKDEYPYEMYCLTCDHVPAYLKEAPEPGDPISSKGVILVDGTLPIPHSDIPCNCKQGEWRGGWAVRERKEIKEAEILSECCKSRMIGGVQCETCGSNGK